MAITNSLIREALSGSGESYDIYGVLNQGNTSTAFSEAINDQMGRIAEQESFFSTLKATRTNTPLTDKVEALVQQEKQRILETHQDVVHPQA